MENNLNGEIGVQRMLGAGPFHIWRRDGRFVPGLLSKYLRPKSLKGMALMGFRSNLTYTWFFGEGFEAGALIGAEPGGGLHFKISIENPGAPMGEPHDWRGPARLWDESRLEEICAELRKDAAEMLRTLRDPEIFKRYALARELRQIAGAVPMPAARGSTPRI